MHKPYRLWSNFNLPEYDNFVNSYDDIKSKITLFTSSLISAIVATDIGFLTRRFRFYQNLWNLIKPATPNQWMDILITNCQIKTLINLILDKEYFSKTTTRSKITLDENETLRKIFEKIKFKLKCDLAAKIELPRL